MSVQEPLVQHNVAEHVDYRKLTGPQGKEQPGSLTTDSTDANPSIIDVSSNLKRENVYSFSLAYSNNNSAHAELSEDETAQDPSTITQLDNVHDDTPTGANEPTDIYEADKSVLKVLQPVLDHDKVLSETNIASISYGSATDADEVVELELESEKIVDDKGDIQVDELEPAPEAATTEVTEYAFKPVDVSMSLGLEVDDTIDESVVNDELAYIPSVEDDVTAAEYVHSDDFVVNSTETILLTKDADVRESGIRAESDLSFETTPASLQPTTRPALVEQIVPEQEDPVNVATEMVAPMEIPMDSVTSTEDSILESVIVDTNEEMDDPRTDQVTIIAVTADAGGHDEVVPMVEQVISVPVVEEALVEDLVSEMREQTFESMSGPSILYDAKDAPVLDNDNTGSLEDGTGEDEVFAVRSTVVPVDVGFELPKSKEFLIEAITVVPTEVETEPVASSDLETTFTQEEPVAAEIEASILQVEDCGTVEPEVIAEASTKNLLSVKPLYAMSEAVDEEVAEAAAEPVGHVQETWQEPGTSAYDIPRDILVEAEAITVEAASDVSTEFAEEEETVPPPVEKKKPEEIDTIEAVLASNVEGLGQATLDGDQEKTDETLLEWTSSVPTLEPPEHNQRPVSPWTPSYSVSSLGGPADLEQELAELERLPSIAAPNVVQDDRDIEQVTVQRETPQPDPEATPLVEVIDALEINSVDVEPEALSSQIDPVFLSLNDEPTLGEIPESPWTPSYSVTTLHGSSPRIEALPELEVAENMNQSPKSVTDFEAAVAAEEDECVVDRVAQRDLLPKDETSIVESELHVKDAQSDKDTISEPVVVESVEFEPEAATEYVPVASDFQALGVTVDDLSEERPKSPWTPSYSVTSLHGSGPRAELRPELETSIGLSEAIPEQEASLLIPEEPKETILFDVRPDSKVGVFHEEVAQESPVSELAAVEYSDSQNIDVGVLREEVNIESFDLQNSEPVHATEEVTDGLTVADQPEEQSKFSWTPSYSVTSLHGLSPRVDSVPELEPNPVVSEPMLDQELTQEESDETCLHVGQIAEDGATVELAVVEHPGSFYTDEGEQVHVVENINQLSVDDQPEERPKSPWTPSYSVTSLHESSLRVDSVPMLDQELIQEEPDETILHAEQVAEVEIVERDAAGVVENINQLSVDDQSEEQPKSPWTPSYSVTSLHESNPRVEHKEGLEIIHSVSEPMFDQELSQEESDESLLHASRVEVSGEQIVEEVTIVDLAAIRYSDSQYADAEGVVPDQVEQGHATENITQLTVAVKPEEQPKLPWTPSFSVTSLHGSSPGVESQPELETTINSDQIFDQDTLLIQEESEGSILYAVPPDSNVVVSGEQVTEDSEGQNPDADAVLPDEIVAESFDLQASEEVYAAENVTEGLKVVDQPDEQPTSPWTPSYSVTMLRGSSPRVELKPELETSAAVSEPILDEELIEEESEESLSHVVSPDSLTEASHEHHEQVVEVSSVALSAMEDSGSQGPDAEAIPSDQVVVEAFDFQASESVHATENDVESLAVSDPSEEQLESPWTPSYSVTTLHGSSPLVDTKPEFERTTSISGSTPDQESSLIHEETEDALLYAVPSGLEAVVSGEQAVEDSSMVELAVVEDYGSHEAHAVVVPDEVEQNVAQLTVADQPEERPKSPWTPSYSVTSLHESSPRVESNQDLETIVGISEPMSSHEASLLIQEESEESILHAVSPDAEVEASHEQVVELATVEDSDSHDTDVGVLADQVVESFNLQASESAYVVENAIHLTVTDEPEERPRSPWTPSYSVTTLPGSNPRLDSVEIEESALTTVENIVSEESLGMTEEQPRLQDKLADDHSSINTEVPITESEEPVPSDVQAAGPVTQMELEVPIIETPQRPWTPSYSSYTQGPGTNDVDDDKDSISSEPEESQGDLSIQTDKFSQYDTSNTNPQDFPSLAESLDPSPEKSMLQTLQTIDPTSSFISGRSRYESTASSHLFPGAWISPTKSLQHEGRASLDEAVGEFIPSTGRSRYESTASSRFFPGAWVSPTKSPQHEGRASLDEAVGEFIPSKPLTVPKLAEEPRERKPRWCPIM